MKIKLILHKTITVTAIQKNIIQTRLSTNENKSIYRKHYFNMRY